MEALIPAVDFPISDLFNGVRCGPLHGMGTYTDFEEYKGDGLDVFSPIDGSKMASLRYDLDEEIYIKISNAKSAFKEWRKVPAPKRGDLIREFGNLLREHKEFLAELVSMECGKIIEEGRGEVQEMIDICDFACGLSRQLYGLTIASERQNHVMHENWLPIGPVGVISAFNFPVAVWAWNFALAIVCGDTVVWKPSEKTPITAIACHLLFKKLCKDHDVPGGLSNLIIGNSSAGEKLVGDDRMALISATGSCQMGLDVGRRVAERFGKSLLELGGNNAIIVTPSADQGKALQSILFGAVGTAGQRCTSTRRVIVHESIFEDFVLKLRATMEHVGVKKVGNPVVEDSLVGPLIDEESFVYMQAALEIAAEDGGEVFFGQRVLEDSMPNAYYVRPALVVCKKQIEVIQRETFAPILYAIPYKHFEDAIIMHNDVAQGLSSAIFTESITEAEHFKRDSDCGIANVNIGTSGAEIGGAFGGEKHTGGGRESGSDAWKAYMRRQTSTTYWGSDVPELAQGIKFDV
jgi:aldehyde dehydrogenase (NAD+)